MAVKNLIFSLSSLIILVFGSILFEYFQDKINDTTWLIVILKDRSCIYIDFHFCFNTQVLCGTLFH